VSTHSAAGSTRSIGAFAAGTRVTVRAPSGNAETLEAKGGPVLFDRTADAGIYRYAVGEMEGYFAVTLADARESDVNSRWAPGGRREGSRPAIDTAQALVPLWPATRGGRGPFFTSGFDDSSVIGPENPA